MASGVSVCGQHRSKAGAVTSPFFASHTGSGSISPVPFARLELIAGPTRCKDKLLSGAGRMSGAAPGPSSSQPFGPILRRKDNRHSVMDMRQRGIGRTGHDGNKWLSLVSPVVARGTCPEPRQRPAGRSCDGVDITMARRAPFASLDPIQEPRSRDQAQRRARTAMREGRAFARWFRRGAFISSGASVSEPYQCGKNPQRIGPGNGQLPVPADDCQNRLCRGAYFWP